MSSLVSIDPDPITYQIVVTSFPASEPLPSYSADPKKVKKPHKPKYQSIQLFEDIKMLSAALMFGVNPVSYTLGALIGAAKPLYDWKVCRMIPSKDLDTDNDAKDWGKLKLEDKASTAAIAFMVPIFVAAVTKNSLPLFSMGVSALVGFSYFYDLSQKTVRWLNPSYSES